MAKTKTTKKKVTFAFAAPNAQRVQLAGDFTGWQQAPLPMKKDKNGLWKTTVSLVPGKYEYRMLVDGEWRDDDRCPHRVTNQFGSQNCLCIVDEEPVPAPG